MSEYAGRIAVGAIVAMVVVVSLGFELSTLGTNSSPTSTSTTISGSSPCSEVFYNQTDGSIVSLSRSCEETGVQGGLGSLNVTSSPALSIISTNGWINTFYVNLTSKQLTLVPGVAFSSNYEQAFYKGQPIINGTKLPTPYASSTATIRNIPTCVFLNGDIHVAYPPLQSGPIYLEVVTDQGALVTNGTVYASHRLSVSSWLGSGDYCVGLSYDTNSTGYVQIADAAVKVDGGDGLPLGGVYNFTIVASLQANQSARVVIPDVVIQPNSFVNDGSNTVVYLKISIPSDQVTMVTVTCDQATSCTETTSTSSAETG